MGYMFKPSFNFINNISIIKFKYISIIPYFQRKCNISCNLFKGRFIDKRRVIYYPKYIIAKGASDGKYHIYQRSDSIDLSKYETQYFSSAQDVQAQILTGKADLAMLAEPAVTATITATATAATTFAAFFNHFGKLPSESSRLIGLLKQYANKLYPRTSPPIPDISPSALIHLDISGS